MVEIVLIGLKNVLWDTTMCFGNNIRQAVNHPWFGFIVVVHTHTHTLDKARPLLFGNQSSLPVEKVSMNIFHPAV